MSMNVGCQSLIQQLLVLCFVGSKLNNERTTQTEDTVARMRTTLDTVTIRNMAVDKNVAKGFFCMSGFFLKPISQLKSSVSIFWLSFFLMCFVGFLSAL